MRKFTAVLCVLVALSAWALTACTFESHKEEVVGTYYAYLWSTEGGYVENKDNYFTLYEDGRCKYSIRDIMAASGLVAAGDPEDMYSGETRFDYDGETLYLRFASMISWEICDGAFRSGETFFGKSDGEKPYEVKDSVRYAKYSKEEYKVFCLDDREISEITIVSELNGRAVKEIMHHAFAYYTELKEVTLERGFSKINYAAFRECVNLQSITLPDGITEIGNRAFFKTAIEEFVMPDSVTSIDSELFGGCESLKSVNVSRNLKTLPFNTFFDCNSLESVFLPKSIVEIESMVFYNTSGLIVNYEGTKSDWGNISKDDRWSYGAENLTVKCSDGDIVYEERA